MHRVAVIGLDAAEPQLVEEMVAGGELPNLARLQASGAQCRLRSESTWRSGRVWETFLTGQADFPSAAIFDPATYETTQLGSRRKEPFYARIPNLKLLAIDVPYMSLWYDVPGAQVIWGGHDAGYPRASRPAGLVREIDARFGVHPAFHNDFSRAWYHEPSIDALADALIVGSRRRVKVIEWLMRKVPDWNLFATVLSEAHSAGEILWHGIAEEHPIANTKTAPLARRRLLDVYREIDRTIGELVALMPRDATVVVCSVHGMEANDYDIPSMTLLPELLCRAYTGKVRLASPVSRSWRRRRRPPVVPAADQSWNDYVKLWFDSSRGRRAKNRLERLWRAARGKSRQIEEFSVPIPPESSAPPEEIAEPRWPLNWQTTCWYRRDWPRMRAFALPVFYDGRVRINLRGRERDGIVEPGDYLTACDEVEQLLRACRNPRDGRPVLANVDRLRAGDPMDPDGPDADLIVTWNPAVDAFDHPRLGLIGPMPFRRTGGHTNRGFLYAVGPQIQPQDLGWQEAIGVTNTIGHLLGAGDARESIVTRRARAA